MKVDCDSGSACDDVSPDFRKYFQGSYYYLDDPPHGGNNAQTHNEWDKQVGLKTCNKTIAPILTEMV